MKWGVQHVKVTLESEDGDTVVVEQDANGRVKCEPGKGGKTERAANSAPPPKAASPAAKQDKAKPERKPPKASGTEASSKAEDAPKAKASAAPGAGKSAARKPRRSAALKWTPVKDHGYEGFAAPSGGGKFKVLKAKDSQWALFYEFKGTWPKHIGCFGRKVDKAQERAQELHDAGWPETEFGPITAGQVARACPIAPGDEDDGGAAPAAAPEPAKTEAKSDTTGTSEAEADRELLDSFSKDVDAVLDEDDDD